MIILSFADKNYEDFMLHSMKQSKRLGYDTMIYDIGGLGFGTKYHMSEEIAGLDVRVKSRICLSKPGIILDAFDAVDELIVYLDASAFLLDNIDEVEMDDYDVGVTYKGGHSDTYINSGVMFIRQTDNARRFLEMWVDRVSNVKEVMKRENPDSIGDQILMNEMVFSYVTKGGRLKDTVQDVNSVRVRFFNAQIYNNTRILRNEKATPYKVKIAHRYGGENRVSRRLPTHGNSDSNRTG